MDNLLHSIGGMNESARVFNKVLKASAFDREAVTKINTAIDRMIKKWRSIQSTLGAPLAEGEIENLKEQLAAAQAEVERLRNKNSDLRCVFGDLMEHLEGVYRDEINPRVQSYWEKHKPILYKVGRDAEERFDKAYPMDSDGNDLDTDYVEPERDELIDMLCDWYFYEHMVQEAA
jgi:archaellum component FlaC